MAFNVRSDATTATDDRALTSRSIQSPSASRVVGTGDAIDLEPVARLEVTYRLLGAGSVRAVDGDVVAERDERDLQLLDHDAGRAGLDHETHGGKVRHTTPRREVAAV